MLELHATSISDKIVVTLTELQTLVAPNYLFVFEHVTTKDVVAFVAPADESGYPYRFNQFSINTSIVFHNSPDGYWIYTAYEQTSSTSLDPAGLHALEYGKMILYGETEFAYSTYDQPTSYKAYNG